MTEPEPQPAANPQAVVTEAMVEAGQRAAFEVACQLRIEKRALDPDAGSKEYLANFFREMVPAIIAAVLPLSRPAADRGLSEAELKTGAAISATDVACYKWPTEAERPLRAAYVQGAVDYCITDRNAADRGQIVEECASVADRAKAADEDYARRYPDEHRKSESRAHRAGTIAAAIRALSPAPAQTEE